MHSRFAPALIAAALAAAAPVHAEEEQPERLVGLAYTTWMRPVLWGSLWGTPQIGLYTSDDRAVIRQHGEWIASAGVDFVFVDWSNNIDFVPGVTPNRPDFELIEDATTLLFEEFAAIENAPKISIFIGHPDQPGAATDGRLQRKADQVHDQYIANPVFRPQVQDYLGKPLLVVYVGTPSPFQSGVPDWDDDRFTVRWMTGFVTEQPNLWSGDRVSHYGYWSWEDRGDQSYTLHEGRPEKMIVNAATRPQAEPGDPGYIPAVGRRGGETLREAFARAREVGVRIALVGTWNEWVLNEQPSAEVSKDLEPSVEFGEQYLDILREEVELFQNPPGRLSLAPAGLVDLGRATVGGPIPVQVVASNTVGAPVQVVSIHTTGAGYSVAAPPTPFEVLPRASAALTVELDAAAPGPAAGSLVVEVSDPESEPLVVVFLAEAFDEVVVGNPSFEADSPPPSPGYTSSISGWQSPASNAGLNTQTMPFWDNGVAPDGAQVAFLQGSGTLRQAIPGFMGGGQYRIQVALNARAFTQTPEADIRFDGQSFPGFPREIPAVQSPGAHTVPWEVHALETTIHATGTKLLEIAQLRPNTGPLGDYTLLVDNVTVELIAPAAVEDSWDLLY